MDQLEDHLPQLEERPPGKLACGVAGGDGKNPISLRGDEEMK